MKKFFALIFLSIVISSFSQNRKKKIEILNFRLDSLNQVLNNERLSSAIKRDQQNLKVTELENQIGILVLDLKKKNEEIQRTRNELENLNLELSKKQDELFRKQIENENAKKESVKKSILIDSLEKSIQNNNITKNVQLSVPTQNLTKDKDKINSDNFNHKSVKIGNQIWMTINLSVDRFRNGDPIQQVKSYDEWWEAIKNKKPAWCYFNFDTLVNNHKTGKFYNYYAVIDERSIAPRGFHIPTEKDWQELVSFVGKNNGFKLSSTKNWDEKCRADNETGFSAIPSGGFYGGEQSYWWGGIKGFMGYLSEENAQWWSTTILGEYNVATIELRCNEIITHDNLSPSYSDEGFTVRCVKD